MPFEATCQRVKKRKEKEIYIHSYQNGIDISVQRIQNVLDAGILGVVNMLLPQTGDPDIQVYPSFFFFTLFFTCI
jgi:hypothetical protein